MDKKPWQSKTILLNTIIALAGLLAMWGVLPGVKIWIEGNTEMILTALGALGVALRMITKGKISIE